VSSGLQGRVSDAHLRGEAACAHLQDKLDLSGAALQTAAAAQKELEKQKRAADKKLVSPSSHQAAELIDDVVDVCLCVCSPLANAIPGLRISQTLLCLLCASPVCVQTWQHYPRCR